MFGKLNTIGRSNIYWYVLLLMGLTLEGVALYFQHVLNEWPCVLCIHVRVLLILLILFSIIALLLLRFVKAHALMHLLVACLSLVLVNRSWVLLATERGWIEGECSIDLGMPVWFAIDKWFPAIFSAWTSCGYTPVIAYGITMAEILLILMSLLFLVSIFLFMATVRKTR